MTKKNNNSFLYLMIFVFLLLIYKQSKQIKQADQKIYINNIIPQDDTEKLEEPRRHYDSKFSTRKRMEINVPTRGEPPEYQQIGILTGEGNENIKPLYGRQTYRGSNQWNYFTSLDSHLATKIPVYLKDNDCTEERGCSELHKGDTVLMGENGNEYTASINGTKAPRYIPLI